MDKFETCVNAARVLSCEMIQKANSGHPGLPLGSAKVGVTLFADMLKFNPKDPNFFDRDRFVLSAGHGSALLYSLLHLFGYKITKEDLMGFRQLGSITPGHPEYKVTPGVEVSTGPLGQGIANAVGMAIAEAKLAAEFNKDDIKLVDHYTYALCGEGCLMEGIGYEASSLAGSLGLGKLIVFYDCNKITIEGSLDNVFDENIAERQKALGWQVIEVDGFDRKAIVRAIKKAQKEDKKPSLIICHTIIGYGSNVAGTSKAHGSPLGEDGLKALKENLNWNCEPFTYPNEIKPILSRAINRGKKAEKIWKESLKAYQAKYPNDYEKFLAYTNPKFDGLLSELDKIDNSTSIATRKSGNIVLNKVAELVPSLIGGSADLAPSNLTKMDSRSVFTKDNYSGSNLRFGIREHAMGAIVNGILAHGGLIPYCSTFFVFSDYMKNAIRMSAIMEIPAIYIFTHDSIGVGEDGPTHEPIEQLAGLRAMPNLNVIRPCDTKETCAAWYTALTDKNPTAICLTRQNLNPHCTDINSAIKGGYVISDSENKKPQAILIATGSEVDTAIKAQQLLKENNIDVRVVSMPCVEQFEKQTKSYKESVLPSNVDVRICVEAGATQGWYKYAKNGCVIGIDEFGLSGKYSQLFEKYGITAENIKNITIKTLNK